MYYRSTVVYNEDQSKEKEKIKKNKTAKAGKQLYLLTGCNCFFYNRES